MSKIRERLEDIVKRHETSIAEWEEETGREAEYGMMSLYLDSYGAPISVGNYDDCLDDGFNAGHDEGMADLAWELLKMLDDE